MKFIKSQLRLNVPTESTLSLNIGLRPNKAKGGVLCFIKSQPILGLNVNSVGTLSLNQDLINFMPAVLQNKLWTVVCTSMWKPILCAATAIESKDVVELRQTRALTQTWRVKEFEFDPLGFSQPAQAV